MSDKIEDLELRTSKLLRGGVIVAGILIAIGWTTTWNTTSGSLFNFKTYDQISLVDTLQLHIRNGNWGILVCYLGLGTLISLPLIRVLLTMVLFIKQKEIILAFISLAVLLALLVSMALGIDL